MTENGVGWAGRKGRRRPKAGGGGGFGWSAAGRTRLDLGAKLPEFGHYVVIIYFFKVIFLEVLLFQGEVFRHKRP